MTPSRAPLVSRYTFHLHARALVLEGLLNGVMVTSDVVARKSLGASQFQLVLLTMAPVATWLVAPFLAHRVEAADRRSLFLWAGVLGRLPVLLVAAITGPWAFLGVMAVQGIVNTAIIPAQNALFQANYDPGVRGMLYGRASVFQWVAQAAVAYAAGRALDAHADAYRWLYPAAALVGFACCLLYGRIRMRRTGRAPAPPLASVEGLGRWSRFAPGRRIPELLRETMVRNAGFRRYEVALFVYGMGFMCMMPVIAPLFVDELDMSYEQASLAKGVVFALVLIASLGPAGKLHDRLGLERLGAISCLLLMTFALCLALVATPLQAIASFAVFGMAMAGIGIVWPMGPIRYAPPGAAARYMAVHLALVGLRAVLGHPLGGWVASLSGSTRPTFFLAAGFFGVATVLMMRAERKGGPPPGIRPAPPGGR